MSGSDPIPEEASFGTAIYTEEGDKLGTIRGFDEHGFYVSLDEGLRELSSEHVTSGGTWGEAELMWRCWECGEMGSIEVDLPDNCPACEAPREELYYWTED